MRIPWSSARNERQSGHRTTAPVRSSGAAEVGSSCRTYPTIATCPDSTAWFATEPPALQRPGEAVDAISQHLWYRNGRNSRNSRMGRYAPPNPRNRSQYLAVLPWIRGRIAAHSGFLDSYGHAVSGGATRRYTHTFSAGTRRLHISHEPASL